MLSLEETLTYKNQRIVDKFRLYFDVDEAEAGDLFGELIRWLWLCAKLRHDRLNDVKNLPSQLNVQSGLVLVDEFWHVFLIHTLEYNDFCLKHFGFFVHHSPSHSGFKPPTQEQTETQLFYINEHLGVAAVLKWYDDYAKRYDVNSIRSIRKIF